MATNDITGDKLITKESNEQYRDGYDRIFRPLCTDCGKRKCECKEAEKSASSLIEDQKND